MTLPLVVCMRWGTRYPASYVNRLARATRRHLRGPCQFVCFTDDPHGLDTDIDARPLPSFDGVPEPYAQHTWRKLSLWRADLPQDLLGRDALVLDLDLVIVGSLDAFFTHHPGRYVVIENWTQRGQHIGNTSVFRVRLGAHPHIYTSFQRCLSDHRFLEFRTEQRFISENMTPGVQVFWPESWFRSFKHDLLPAWPVRLFVAPRLPPDARIVAFHGKPDPDEALVGAWPAPFWKKIYKTARPSPWIATHWC